MNIQRLKNMVRKLVADHAKYIEQKAIDSWENEGGEILEKPIYLPAGASADGEEKEIGEQE